MYIYVYMRRGGKGRGCAETIIREKSLKEGAKADDFGVVTWANKPNPGARSVAADGCLWLSKGAGERERERGSAITREIL